MPSVRLLLDLVRLMASRALKARRDIALGVVAELAGTVLTVAGPYVLKVLVDTLSTRQVATDVLTLYVALFVLTWTGTSLTTAYRLVHTNKIGDKLARHLFGEALRAQLPVIARERSGDTGRVLGLLERLPYSLQVVIEGLLWRAAPLLIQTGVSLAVISTLVPLRYVLMMAAILAGYFVAAHFGSGRYQERSRQTNRAAGSVSQALGDVLRNARRVVFNGNMESELRHIAEQSTGKLEAGRSMSWSLVQMQGLQYGVVGLGLMLLLVLGGLDVAGGRLTIGGWVLLQAYAFRLALPLSGFGFMLQQSGVALANIRDVLDLSRRLRHSSSPNRSWIGEKDHHRVLVGITPTGLRYHSRMANHYLGDLHRG